MQAELFSLFQDNELYFFFKKTVQNKTKNTFDKQQSSLVLMTWKKNNLDKGEEENCPSERINAPCMGFVLKKKRRKLPTSRQREKDNIKNNPVFAPGCSTERDSEIYTATRPPGGELVS